MLNLLHFDDALFVEYFDGIKAGIMAGANEVDTPERASAKGSNEVEIT